MTRDPRPRRTRACAVLLGVLVALATVSCDTGPAEAGGGGLSEGEFEDIVVELRVAEREAALTDSPRVGFERRKAEVLERHGRTEDELEAFAREAAGDLERHTAIWDRISTRLREDAGTRDEES